MGNDGEREREKKHCGKSEHKREGIKSNLNELIRRYIRGGFIIVICGREKKWENGEHRVKKKKGTHEMERKTDLI